MLVLLKTSFEKSLTYQLPAVVGDSKTASVISLLLSLMKDQVIKLKNLGILAASIGSDKLG